MHNRSLTLYAGCEMSNSLDPTRGARCCRERVLRYPFPTQGSQASSPNPALNLAPFGRWTLRDKAAQRRLALR